eukprot:1451340-Prymnesium_polylepis.1
MLSAHSHLSARKHHAVRTPTLPAHPPAGAAGGRRSAAGGRGVAVADAGAREYGDRSTATASPADVVQP